jgi:hypothetical protein
LLRNCVPKRLWFNLECEELWDSSTIQGKNNGSWHKGFMWCLTSYAAPGRVNVKENQETRSKTKISKMMTDIVRSKLCPFFYLFVQFVLLLETQGTASSGLVWTHFCDWKASSVSKWDLKPRIYCISFHEWQYRIIPLTYTLS